MYDFAGKVALVTGVSGKKGIGRATALRLAKEGADVIVSDVQNRPTKDREWRGMTEVVAEIEAMGRRSLGITADVTSADQVGRMVDQVMDQFGHIDILVNNAGALAGKDRVAVVDLTEEAYDHVMNVNVKGTFLCTRAVAKTMISRSQGGRIINMSSTSGRAGRPRFAAYCASKFAIRGFTQAAARDLAPHNINVNAVCPGLIETERTDDMVAVLSPNDLGEVEARTLFIERALQGNPMKRMGQPAEVAGVIAFLASVEANYLTGLSIIIDGGTMMD